MAINFGILGRDLSWEYENVGGLELYSIKSPRTLEGKQAVWYY